MASQAAGTQEQDASTSLAENLVGYELPGGWVITEKHQRPGTPGATDLTGSFFSIGYTAKKTEQTGKGQKKETGAFVKVIDVQKALRVKNGMTLMERLKSITDSHAFECSILDVCIRAKLDRIVNILGQGEFDHPDNSGGVAVPYIIFELADGDIRKIVSRSNKLDDAWRLRVLHNVAVGLQQLHGQKIAHQDLKPSNVLMFDKAQKGAKIGDLGRASQQGNGFEHDKFVIAGHPSYAPPEQVYGIRPERWEDRREGCDLYHLGSLATFLFAGTTPTDHYVQSLPANLRPLHWNGQGTCNYATAIPILTMEFTAFLLRIQQDLPSWAREELTSIIENACTPDFNRRGDPQARKKVGEPIGIESFVSRFDRLAKRAEIEVQK